MHIHPINTAIASYQAMPESKEKEPLKTLQTSEKDKVFLSAEGFKKAYGAEAEESAGVGAMPDAMRELIERMQELQQQANELMVQINQVMSDGSLGADEKLQQVAPLQEQLAGVQAQLVQLVAQLMQMLDSTKS